MKVVVSHPFSAVTPKKNANVTRISIQFYGFCFLLSFTHYTIAPQPIIPRFQNSIIPVAERSGEKFGLVAP
jgi:hypothetical protein